MRETDNQPPPVYSREGRKSRYKGTRALRGYLVMRSSGKRSSLISGSEDPQVSNFEREGLDPARARVRERQPTNHEVSCGRDTTSSVKKLRVLHISLQSYR